MLVFTDPGNDCGIWLFCRMTDVLYAPVLCMQMQHAFPLIYWCVGLCHEYAKLQRCCTIDEIIPNSQVFSSCCPVRTPRGSVMGVFFRWHRHRGVSTDVLITSHHATPKCFAPPHWPCQSPSPSFAVSICSLALGLEQRAIWARIPASSGGPLHRKDSFSSTSVWQHQTHFCLPPPQSISLLHFFSTSPSLISATKTSHTLDRNYAKCSTLLPLHVSLRLCRFSALLFSQNALFSVWSFFR